jgi:hypothetical protein
MAKATMTMGSGAKVIVEGSQEEVAALLARFEAGTGRVGLSPPQLNRRRQNKSKPTLMNLLSELSDVGFFEERRALGAVKTALEEKGHHYPVTTLSPVMLRLVRRRQLRRVKEKGRWFYVQ